MKKTRVLAWIGITLLAVACAGGYGMLAEMPVEEVGTMVWWVIGVSAIAGLSFWIAEKRTPVEDAKYRILDTDTDWEAGFSTRSGRPMRDSYHNRTVDRERSKMLEAMNNTKTPADSPEHDSR